VSGDRLDRVRAAHWRTAVDAESKLLLMTHAFEDLGMGRLCW
jgi:N-acetyltransferase